MFGKRCTLCGGKLNSKRVCTECGLDNNRSEKYYKINQSSCDGMPMTHIHPDDEQQNELKQYEAKKYAPRQYEPKQYESKQYDLKQYKVKKLKEKKLRKKDVQWKNTGMDYGKSKKKGWAKKAVSIFVILSVLGTVIETVAELGVDNIVDKITGETHEESYSYNPYSRIEENGITLPEEGEAAEFSLTSGNYIVGVNLPAGDYAADTQNEFDVVKVQDQENSIFLYEYTGKDDTNYLDDLRLFDGAVVEIVAEAPVTLTTQNAQGVQYEDTPLTQEYQFTGSTQKEAGVDFEPGVYDITVTKGSGSIKFTVITDKAQEDQVDDEEGNSWSIYMGESDTEGNVYKNVVLPEGAKITMGDDEREDKMTVNLSPSPKIASTDYMQTYRQYFYY